MPRSPTPADELGAKITALPEVTQGKSRWSDWSAFSVAGREFVHFHGPHEVDIRLTTRLQSLHRARLREDARVGFRRNRSEWVTFSLQSAEDIEAALAWIRLARDANRR